jgi:3-vinyl bacteriochlorophyllide hydratase
MGTLDIDQVRTRRAASVWTRIHPIFALGQLGAFIVSIGFLVLMIGAIVTGALWEKDVFNWYWFAPEFFFEDAMTVNVFLLHLGYLAIVYTEPGNPAKALLMLGLAYVVYTANVVQYVWRTHKMGVDAAIPVVVPK